MWAGTTSLDVRIHPDAAKALHAAIRAPATSAAIYSERLRLHRGPEAAGDGRFPPYCIHLPERRHYPELVGIKCVEQLTNEHLAQCINYLKASGLHLALLIDFRKSRVEWRRVVHNL